MRLKGGFGRAKTAFGSVGFQWHADGTVGIDDGNGLVEGFAYLDENRRGFALVLNPGGKGESLNEGPSDKSVRRAIERGLKEMVGYVL